MSDEVMDDEASEMSAARERNEKALDQILAPQQKPVSAKLLDALTTGLGIGSAEAADLAPQIKPPGDDSVKNDFLAARAQANDADAWKQFQQNFPDEQAAQPTKPKPKPKKAEKPEPTLDQTLMGSAAPAQEQPNSGQDTAQIGPNNGQSSPSTPGAKPEEQGEEDMDEGPPKTIARRILDGLSTIAAAPKAIAGMAEAGTEMTTNFLASIPAIPMGIYKAIQAKDPQAFASEFQYITHHLTEEAQTPEGKTIMSAMSDLMGLLEKGADWTADRQLLEGHPAAQALVKAGIMVAPMLLGLRRGKGEVPRETDVPEVTAPTVEVTAKRVEPGMGEEQPVGGQAEPVVAPDAQTEAAAVSTPEPTLSASKDRYDAEVAAAHELPEEEQTAAIKQAALERSARDQEFMRAQQRNPGAKEPTAMGGILDLEDELPWGKPEQVAETYYHGTPTEFEGFEAGKSRNAIAFTDAEGLYFTSSKEDAAAYAKGKNGEEGSVIPVKLNIKKPFTWPEDDLPPTYISPAKRAQLERQGYDSIIYKNGREVVVFDPAKVTRMDRQSAEMRVRTAEYLGWPSADTLPDNALAVPNRIEPTVTVPDGVRAKWSDFLAQQKGEAPTPLEANAQPLAGQRSADFSATGSNPVKINLNQIEGPADLKDALARISTTIPKQEVRPNEAAMLAADGLGMTAEDFLEGRATLPLSDAETVALRSVTNAVGLELAQAAAKAARVGATPEDQAAALALYAKAHDLIGFFEQAKVAAGRSVQSFGIKLDADRTPFAEAVRKINETVEPNDVNEFMRQIAALTDEAGQPDPVKVMRFVNAMPKRTPSQWMMWGFYNALLGVKTTIKKATTDVLMPMYDLAVRYQAERAGRAGVMQVSPEGAVSTNFNTGVAPGETAMLAIGRAKSFMDALRLGNKSLKAGRSLFDNQFTYLDAMGETRNLGTESDRTEALGREMPGNLPIDQPTTIGAQYIKAMLGPLYDYRRALIPTSQMAGIDDFAKYWAYRSELYPLAHRDGYNKGLRGQDLETHVTQQLNVIPQWMHDQAMSAQRNLTFHDPLEGFAADFKNMADNFVIPMGTWGDTHWELPLGRMIAPMIQIPSNMVRWSYHNSPLPVALRSEYMRNVLSKPGPQRDLAISRMVIGSGAVMALTGATLNGMVTGRGPFQKDMADAWRLAGNKPYWFNPTGKEGDGFGFNQIEPLGTTLGVIADTYNVMKFAPDNERADMATSLVMGIGESLLSKTTMQGVAGLFEALAQPDVKGTKWFDQYAAAWVPSDIKGMTRASDPWMRSHYDMLEAIESKLFFNVPSPTGGDLLSKSSTLPFARTMWGDPIPLKDAYMPFATHTGAARWLSSIPVASENEQINPIDRWKWEHRLNFLNGPEGKIEMVKPGRVQTFSAGPHLSATVELTPEQHDRQILLTGNELKIDLGGGKPMGAKDTLNALVTNSFGGSALQRQWNNASDASRALLVVTVFNQFKAGAKQQLLQEYPDLQDAIRTAAAYHAQQLTAPPSTVPQGATQ